MHCFITAIVSTTHLAILLLCVTIPVDQLSSVAVKNYKDIEDRMAEGTKNRTIASTNMNATSSRAHTIVAITFIQKSKNKTGQQMTKSSVINMVDLAGRYIACC